jgi:Flp pilus assembly protein TadB
MFENFIGWILIAIGVFMIFIGNLIIRRVVAIEV